MVHFSSSTSGLNPVIQVVEGDELLRPLVSSLAHSIGIPCRAFASPHEFLEQYSPGQPGCIVLDILIPGMCGLQLQHELNRRGNITPILFVTGHTNVPSVVEAMRRGAMNYLIKPVSSEDLVDNLRCALDYDRCIREAHTRLDSIRARILSLTPREREVLDLVARGCANKAMAQEMGLSRRTVELHRARMMEKMAARSVADLVRMLLDFERPAATVSYMSAESRGLPVRERA
ncbi:MAG TPA: response regulator [Steroidobacteraceae bacterium]